MSDGALYRGVVTLPATRPAATDQAGQALYDAIKYVVDQLLDGPLNSRLLARGGTQAELESLAENPLDREILATTDTRGLWLGDGATPYGTYIGGRYVNSVVINASGFAPVQHHGGDRLNITFNLTSTANNQTWGAASSLIAPAAYENQRLMVHVVRNWTNSGGTPATNWTVIHNIPGTPSFFMDHPGGITGDPVVATEELVLLLRANSVLDWECLNTVIVTAEIDENVQVYGSKSFGRNSAITGRYSVAVGHKHESTKEATLSLGQRAKAQTFGEFAQSSMDDAVSFGESPYRSQARRIHIGGYHDGNVGASTPITLAPFYLKASGIAGTLSMPIGSTWFWRLRATAFNLTANVGATWEITGSVRRTAATGTAVATLGSITGSGAPLAGEGSASSLTLVATHDSSVKGPKFVATDPVGNDEIIWSGILEVVESAKV
jgi:hypothetical protein